jgi:hypothetical protein
MCVARTARRRRRQAALGVRGLEQVFGKRRAPKYKKTSREHLDHRAAKQRERLRMLAARGYKGK